MSSEVVSVSELKGEIEPCVLNQIQANFKKSKIVAPAAVIFFKNKKGDFNGLRKGLNFSSCNT